MVEKVLQLPQCHSHMADICPIDWLLITKEAGLIQYDSLRGKERKESEVQEGCLVVIKYVGSVCLNHYILCQRMAKCTESLSVLTH